MYVYIYIYIYRERERDRYMITYCIHCAGQRGGRGPSEGQLVMIDYY